MLFGFDQMCCLHIFPIKEYGHKSISLNSSKVLLPSRNDNSLHTKSRKRRSVLLPRIMNDRNHYPQQVSDDQASSDRSEFAFSSGASLPANDNSASRYVFGGREHTSHRLNGYGENRLNTNVSQAQQSRQGNEVQSSTIRNNISNNPVITRPPRHPDYVDSSERLRSYARWRHRKPDPQTLTNAGFFYTNDADLVRCYQCGIGLKDFCEEDNPLHEHVKHSGDCPYLLEYLGASQLAAIRRQLQSQDPEFNRRIQWSERHRYDPANAVYRHPEYQTFEARLGSFTNWPPHMIQTPNQLAEAGLYHTGHEDRVRCFACDGGLQHWDPEDDPWTEHCRWFPACPFARTQKGDDFIAAIQAAIAMENQENITGNGISAALERMEIRDPELQAAINELKDACKEMGYPTEEIDEAIKELRERGTNKPTVEEIIDVIEVIKRRKTQNEVLQAVANETPAEENQRLKKIILCMKCGLNETNCLFLPCTHHRLCMECAAPLSKCIVCDKNIRQKIRTFMA
ncbi:baculoviral IAP repeat-containing protein 7-B-like [Ruditapes philippinarum]|uniref:baculoviral IAP repeat-containing protein 7-B-like n=1 Tax=Ruditapes philippinarum TaxID=129788 RepID=UPI00295AFF41|nr:baculoviral IAP repeat-containing protein 7-B-like [Ruditapes philippinarum]